jgi:hypothetical protein
MRIRVLKATLILRIRDAVGTGSRLRPAEGKKRVSDLPSESGAKAEDSPDTSEGKTVSGVLVYATTNQRNPRKIRDFDASRRWKRTEDRKSVV